MQDPRFFPLVLHRLPDVGPVTYSRLIAHFGTAQAVLTQPITQLEALLKPSSLNALADFQRSPNTSLIAQKVLADLEWLNSHPDTLVVTPEDANYPTLLQQIPKPPPLLFIRGEVNCLSLPQIAIVGSRNPSSGGLDNAHCFAEYLAANGFVITSGLAMGVDAAAHQGALIARGKTIAVLGTGINIAYPARHSELAQRILDTGGALVSEFPLGTGAHAANFPQRNRIISGLSCGVLVIEAAIKSGSLITARTALQQDREVFAIPGSIHNPLARGCHQLIRQGATLVETANDIVDQLHSMLSYQRQGLLNVQKDKHQSPPKHLKHLRPDSHGINSTSGDIPLETLSAAEQQLMAAIGFDPVTIDELVVRTGYAIGSLMAQLVGLEIKGFLQQSGGSYQRI